MKDGSVITRPAALRLRDTLYQGGPVVVALIAIIAVIVLWRREVFPTNFVGEAQSPASLITSPQDGRLLEVEVELFDEVQAGQALAKVRIMSDETLQRSLAVLRSDLEVMRIRLLQDQQRNDLNQFQVWRDFMDLRIELAGARIRLRQAETEYERVRQLYEDRLVPVGAGADQDGFEVALRDRDLLRAEVADKEALLTELESRLARLSPGDGTNFMPQLQTAIDQAVRSQEEQMRDLESAAVLRAPTNGMVMKVYRHQGEQVVQGEPLFEIQGTQPQWILGYVRQPIAYRPNVGDTVRVRSRGRPRREADATVQRVGAHLQAFAQPLRARGFDASQERGLPVLLSYPVDLDLSPGELVDLLPVNAE